MLGAWLASELGQDAVDELVERAFNFDLPLVAVDEQRLPQVFHGPTLAFKDFGARFMAQCVNTFVGDTLNHSDCDFGDTGAAVADAFMDLRKSMWWCSIQKVQDR